MSGTELVVGALKGDPCRASVQQSLYYLEFNHPGFQMQQTCLRAFLQLARVTPEAHPSRTDPLVNLG